MQKLKTLYQQIPLKLTIQKAEDQFLSKNILLLAEKCNIDAAKAEYYTGEIMG